MNKLLLAILVGIAVYCLMSKKPNNERLMWAVGIASVFILWANCNRFFGFGEKEEYGSCGARLCKSLADGNCRLTQVECEIGNCTSENNWCNSVVPSDSNCSGSLDCDDPSMEGFYCSPSTPGGAGGSGFGWCCKSGVWDPATYSENSNYECANADESEWI